MLTDADGNVADVEMDADSVIKRMNLAKLYEQFVNACSSATTKRIRNMLKDKQTDKEYEKAWDYILGYYKIVSPRFYEAVGESGIDPKAHIDSIVADGIYLEVYTDNPVNHPEMVKALMQHYPPCYGPCTYVDQLGNKVTTESPILIGEVYFIMLEKIANSFSSVASAKLQHMGLPAKPTKRNKYSEPTRTSPTRTAGESEVRLFTSVAGGRAVADLLDRSTNPIVHEQIVKNILLSKEPTNVFNFVDRDQFPIGQGPILNLTHHILECGGVKITRGDMTDDIEYSQY